MDKDIETLIAEIAGEINKDSIQRRTPEEAKLHSVAQQLLLLERELRAPGAARSAEDRANGLLEAIAKEAF